MDNTNSSIPSNPIPPPSGQPSAPSPGQPAGSRPAPPPPPPPRPPMPPQPYPYPAPVKQRRVGTFTLGLTLILIGVMIPLSMFWREDVIQWFQLAPIVLIFLGIEVLYFAIRYREGKLKYDGVSIFLVIMLTFFSLATAWISPFFTGYSRYDRKVQEQHDTICTTVSDRMFEKNYEGRVYASSYGSDYWNSVRHQEGATIRMNVYATLTDIGIEATEISREQAAQAMLEMIQAVASTNVPINEINIEVNPNGAAGSYGVMFELYGRQIDKIDLSRVLGKMGAFGIYDETWEPDPDSSGSGEDSSSLPEGDDATGVVVRRTDEALELFFPSSGSRANTGYPGSFSLSF